MADPEFGAFQAKECQNHLENAVLSKLPVEILVGKKNLEVRPTIVNKGEIVKRLLSQHPDVEFVMCAGDDKTDEDMFRALAGISNAHGANNNNGNKGNHNGTVIEPYNDELVAETAAKISQATLAHSREHSPAVPHWQATASGNTLAVQDGPFLKPSVAVGETASSSVSSSALPEASTETAATATPTPDTSSVTATQGPKEHFSITIGHALKKTLANWHVTSPEELIRVLGILSGVIEG